MLIQYKYAMYFLSEKPFAFLLSSHIAQTNSAWSPEIERIRNSFYRKRSGDLMIDVLPGWTIVQEKANDNRVVRDTEITAPLIFLGTGIKPETINIPVSSTRIAPTISNIMQMGRFKDDF